MTKVKRSLLNKKEIAFVATVWSHYESYGRHDLPWRHTTDPYQIVVSELMLQQTQVTRVVPKYQAFLKQFKNTNSLASAPLGDVLRAWQGLGYNRRAKFLHEAARAVQEQHKGRWPEEYKELLSLPGIGSYTASAIMVFAHNKVVPFIETNVRSVYLHHFFPNTTAVPDATLTSVIVKTFSRERPREWGWALMDYGSHLKTVHGNDNKRSATYTAQSAFKDSNRYVRGAILRGLISLPKTIGQLQKELISKDNFVVEEQLLVLVSEGLVVNQKGKYRLP